MMGIIDKYKQKVTQKLNLSKGHFIMWFNHTTTLLALVLLYCAVRYCILEGTLDLTILNRRTLYLLCGCDHVTTLLALVLLYCAVLHTGGYTCSGLLNFGGSGGCGCGCV